jgi:hypothetical protein
VIGSLDAELGAIRDDGGQDFGRGDDATDGKDRKLVDPARDRGADLAALQAVLDSGKAIFQLLQAGFDDHKLFLCLVAGKLVDGEDAHPHFADPGLRPCDVRVQLTQPAPELHQFALCLVQTLGLDQAIPVQVGDPVIAFLDKHQFIDKGVTLRLQGDDFVVDLDDAEFQLLALVVAIGEVALMQAGFAGDDLGQGRVVAAEAGWKDDLALPVPVGDQAGAARFGLVHLGAEDGPFGQGLGVIQAEHQLPGLHLVPFADEDLGDDAAVKMLNLLEVLVDLDRAGGDDRAAELRGEGPSANAAKKGDGEDQAENHTTAKPVIGPGLERLRIRCCTRFHVTSPIPVRPAGA